MSERTSCKLISLPLIKIHLHSVHQVADDLPNWQTTKVLRVLGKQGFGNVLKQFSLRKKKKDLILQPREYRKKNINFSTCMKLYV